MTATKPWGHLITQEKALDLYAHGIEGWGGDPSPPKHGCLEGAIGNAWTAEVYRDDEMALPGLWFGAYLLRNIAKDHCFSDGNKRLAWLSLVHVLLGLGLTLKTTTDEAEAFVLRVSDEGMTPDEIAEWIAERVVEATPPA